MEGQISNIEELSSIEISDISSVRQTTGSLKQVLDQHLEQLTLSVEKGVDELKRDFHKQVQSIHITIPGNTSSSSTIGNLWNIRRTVRGTDPLEEENGKLKDKLVRLKKENTRLQEKIEDVEKELITQRERVGHEREQRSNTSQQFEYELGRQNQIVKDLEAKGAVADRQIRMLSEQNGKYRSIILNRNSGSGEAVDDAKVVMPFIGLRDQIQRITFKFYKPNQTPRALQASATQRQRQFFDCWQYDMSDAQLQNRIRAMIFELLSDHILCEPCFGIDRIEHAEQLESSLVSFEHALIEEGRMRKEHEAEIAEWRTRTVNCAGWLCGEDRGQKPHRVAQLIWEFMAPIMPPAHLTSAREDLHNHLYRLCDSALKLTLLMRSCKDVFRCQRLGKGDIFISEDAEIQDSERRSSRKADGSRISFSISGMLVKYPEDNLEDRIVLEKAHVVIMD